MTIVREPLVKRYEDLAAEQAKELEDKVVHKLAEFPTAMPGRTVVEETADSMRIVRGIFLVPNGNTQDTGWPTSFQQVDSIIPVNYVTILAPGILRRLNSAMFVGYGTEMFYDGVSSPPPNCDMVFSNWSGYPASFGPEGVTLHLPLQRHIFTIAFGSGGSLTVGAPLSWTFIFKRITE